MEDIEIDETILTEEVIHQMMFANEGVSASTRTNVCDIDVAGAAKECETPDTKVFLSLQPAVSHRCFL